jgi:exonuclease SbcC
MVNKKGSFWSKWDLHVHSPYTNMNSQYNCTVEDFCKSIRESGIKVIGLTNYFIIHENEYNEVIKDLNGEILVIPNIEFRTNDKNGNNEYINVHVLFNPLEISIKGINEWLSRVEVNNIASPTLVYCTKDNLEGIGYENVTISLDRLVEQLKKDFNQKDFIIAGVPNGYGGFHPDNKPRSIELAKKIDELSNIMFGRIEDRDFFLSTDNGRAKAGFKPKPNFICSDAHTIAQIGSKSTWVKSEPSFEGLRQTLIEPKYRLDCNENVRKPYRIIESIKFDFPADTQLKSTQTNTLQPFCLTGLKNEINFSPYFTCIIGGRGSGKSTIINIIAEKLGERTEFFQNNKIIVNGNNDILKNHEDNCIKIEGTNEIEFISQGKVEELSQGSHLTDLIFNERIKAIGNEYENKEKLLFSKFIILDESITIIKNISLVNTKLNSNKSSLQNDLKIVKSIENDIYKALSKKVNDVTNQIEKIITNKENYENLLSSLVDIAMDNKISNLDDEYANRISEIIFEIEKLEEITPIENGYSTSKKIFVETDKVLENKQIELTALKLQIVEYFTSIGTTPDSIADVDRATSNIAIISSEIKELEAQIITKKGALQKNISELADLKVIAEECTVIVLDRLEKINGDLNIENENVEKIRFEFGFDEEKYKKTLYSDFYEQFKSYHKSGMSWDNINWCLNLIEPNEQFLEMTHEQFLSGLALKSYDKKYTLCEGFSRNFRK